MTRSHSNCFVVVWNICFVDCWVRPQDFVPWLSTWLTIDLAPLTVDWQLLWEQTGEILFPDNTVPTFVIVSAITIIVIIIVDIITTSQHHQPTSSSPSQHNHCPHCPSRKCPHPQNSSCHIVLCSFSQGFSGSFNFEKSLWILNNLCQDCFDTIRGDWHCNCGSEPGNSKEHCCWIARTIYLAWLLINMVTKQELRIYGLKVTGDE